MGGWHVEQTERFKEREERMKAEIKELTQHRDDLLGQVESAESRIEFLSH